MVIFGAATGLRPSELFGLEQHDVDREAGVIYVRRAFANGTIKSTKTRLSTRAVPLQAKAVEALDRLPASVNPILFPNARGGRIDFRVFGRRHWRPAQIAAGVASIRGLYDLRHTYATFALRAGVPVFAVSRFIGSSIAMIDRTTATWPETAASTQSRYSMRSRSSGRWTLGGRRADTARTRLATAIRRPIGDVLTGAWTFGGRRGLFLSPRPTTKGADQQELPEAL
jgi:integrase